MSSVPQPCVRNALLASFSAESRRSLWPHLQLVRLERGETLHEMCGAVLHAHFPLDALVSAFVDTVSGASAEVALVGAEGALGVLTALSGVRGNFRAVVDTAGDAYRVKLPSLRAVLALDPGAHRVFMRYLTARTVQIAVNAVCNAHHSVQQRFCRALLMRLDRCTPGAELHVTQALIADALGVRRTGITKVASELRRAGAIQYARGKLIVVNRELLQRYACTCNAAIAAHAAMLAAAGA
jgi:CRP-like cAMP-binding protein